MVTRRIDLLQQLAIFGGASEETLNLILKNSECICRKPGELFFQEHSHPDGMFVLESGTVEIYKTWEGEEFSLSQLHSGDCFGEMALVDLRGRSASVRAVDFCQAIMIPTKVLSEVAHQDVEQYALIYMNMGREICRRLRQADEDHFQDMVAKRGRIHRAS